jgi:hypothetical protein
MKNKQLELVQTCYSGDPVAVVQQFGHSVILGAIFLSDFSAKSVEFDRNWSIFKSLTRLISSIFSEFLNPGTSSTPHDQGQPLIPSMVVGVRGV